MVQPAFSTRGSAALHKDRFAYQQYVIKRPFLSFLSLVARAIKEEMLDLSPGGEALDHRFAVACALLALIKEAAREDP